MEIRKFIITVQAALSNHMAYRVNFLLEFLAPALIFYFVKYNIWTNIFASSGKEFLRGYTLESMLAYQAWVLVLSLCAQTYRGTDLSLDIRHGRISSFLLYPFNFAKYHLARFIAFLGIQVCIASVTVLLFASLNVISIPTLSFLTAAIIIVLLGSLFWFSYQYITGLIAFWLEETWVFRVLFLICTQFLSGSLIPLEFFPTALLDFLHYTPFPYLTYYPVKLFLQATNISYLPIYTLAIWTFVMVCIAKFIWSRGIRLYTAAGM